MNNSSFVAAMSIYFLIKYLGQSLKVKGPKHSKSVFWNKDGQHAYFQFSSTLEQILRKSKFTQQKYHKKW